MFALGVFFWLQYVIWAEWLFGLAVRMEHEAEAARQQQQSPIAAEQKPLADAYPNSDSFHVERVAPRRISISLKSVKFV